jgi:integrase
MPAPHRFEVTASTDAAVLHTEKHRLASNIHRVPAPNGGTQYRVQIRRRGYPDISQVFPVYEDALAYRDSMLGTVAAAKVAGVNPKLTVGQVIDHYERSPEFLSLRTRRDRKRYLAHWRAVWGDEPCANITPLGVQREAQALSRSGKKANTVLVYLACGSKLFNYAAVYLKGPPNPFVRGTKPKQEKTPPQWIPPADVRVLLEAADRSEWPLLGLLLRLALTTTARKGALMQRRWRDVNLTRGVILVPRTKNEHPIELVVRGKALELLKAEAVRTSAPRNALIFPSERKPSVPFEFRDHYDAAVKAAGLSGVPFKALRSTGISEYLAASADLKTVQEISGHKTPQVLLTNYAHVSNARKLAAVERLADSILGE